MWRYLLLSLLLMIQLRNVQTTSIIPRDSLGIGKLQNQSYAEEIERIKKATRRHVSALGVLAGFSTPSSNHLAALKNIREAPINRQALQLKTVPSSDSQNPTTMQLKNYLMSSTKVGWVDDCLNGGKCVENHGQPATTLQQNSPVNTNNNKLLAKNSNRIDSSANSSHNDANISTAFNNGVQITSKHSIEQELPTTSRLSPQENENNSVKQLGRSNTDNSNQLHPKSNENMTTNKETSSIPISIHFNEGMDDTHVTPSPVINVTGNNLLMDTPLQADLSELTSIETGNIEDSNNNKFNHFSHVSIKLQSPSEANIHNVQTNEPTNVNVGYTEMQTKALPDNILSDYAQMITKKVSTRDALSNEQIKNGNTQIPCDPQLAFGDYNPCNEWSSQERYAADSHDFRMRRDDFVSKNEPDLQREDDIDIGDIPSKIHYETPNEQTRRKMNIGKSDDIITEVINSSYPVKKDSVQYSRNVNGSNGKIFMFIGGQWVVHISNFSQIVDGLEQTTMPMDNTYDSYDPNNSDYAEYTPPNYFRSPPSMYAYHSKNSNHRTDDRKSKCTHNMQQYVFTNGESKDMPSPRQATESDLLMAYKNANALYAPTYGNQDFNNREAWLYNRRQNFYNNDEFENTREFNYENTLKNFPLQQYDSSLIEGPQPDQTTVNKNDVHAKHDVSLSDMVFIGLQLFSMTPKPNLSLSDPSDVLQPIEKTDTDYTQLINPNLREASGAHSTTNFNRYNSFPLPYNYAASNGGFQTFNQNPPYKTLADPIHDPLRPSPNLGALSPPSVGKAQNSKHNDNQELEFVSGQYVKLHHPSTVLSKSADEDIIHENKQYEKLPGEYADDRTQTPNDPVLSWPLYQVNRRSKPQQYFNSLQSNQNHQTNVYEYLPVQQYIANLDWFNKNGNFQPRSEVDTRAAPVPTSSCNLLWTTDAYPSDNRNTYVHPAVDIFFAQSASAPNPFRN